MALKELGKILQTFLDFALRSTLSLNDIDDIQKALENILKKHPEDLQGKSYVKLGCCQSKKEDACNKINPQAFI
jgi:hypothetical protein